jgi:O-antigen/teichoic acid export membrane protein
LAQERTRLVRLTRLLVSFVSLQGATQLASGLAGILAVRVLPVPAFAVYAIALSVQTSIAALSDVGVTTVVLARAGQNHADPARLAVLAATARRYRLQLTIPALLAGAPLLFFSLGSARPDLTSCLAIFGLLGAIVLLQLSASIDGALLLAQLRANAQLMAQLLAAIARLALIASLLAFLPTVLIALVINCVALALQAWLQRFSVHRLIPRSSATSAEDLRAFREFVKRQYPNAIHFAFSSQITLWLISIFSSSTVVANVGALGRLTGLIILLQGSVITLVAPRVARLSDPQLIWKRYSQVVGASCVLSSLGLLAAFLIPGPLLWIIGPKYASLRDYLPLAMTSAVIYLVSTTFFSMNSSRAWVVPPAFAIPFTLGTQALAAYRLNLSDTRGALLFSAVTALPPLMMNALLAWKQLRHLLTPRAQLVTGEPP